MNGTTTDKAEHTPRTDALIAELRKLRSHGLLYPGEVTLADLCKRLETENAETAAQRDELLAVVKEAASIGEVLGWDGLPSKQAIMVKWRTAIARCEGRAL